MRGYPHPSHAVLILVAVQVVILSAPGMITEGGAEPLGLEPLRHRESVANQAGVVGDVSRDSPVSDARQVTVARAVLLPLILRGEGEPGVPLTPLLRTIENPDGDGEYTIRWDAAVRAQSYGLLEADNATFLLSTELNVGSATTYRATGRVFGRYYYRVRAHNDQGASGWSNVEWVDVRWEDEPNNSYQEATGPLESGQEYHGYPDDLKDYFSLFVESPGQITVDLTEHTGKGVQLQLFFESTANSVADDRTPPDYHIAWDGSAGTYYVYIYTESGHNTNTAYKLQTVHP